MLQAFRDDKDFAPPAAQQDAYTWFPACREVALVGLQSVLLFSYSQYNCKSISSSCWQAGRFLNLSLGKTLSEPCLRREKDCCQCVVSRDGNWLHEQGLWITFLLESVILSKYTIISTQLTLHFSGVCVSIYKK